MPRPDRSSTDRCDRTGSAAAGRRRLGLAAGLIATLAIAAASPVSSARSAPDPATQARLIHLLVQDCGSCHGLTLKGGLGAPLLPETLADRDAETLAAIILDGIPGTPMPPWRGLIGRDEALFLAETLKKGITP